MINSKIKSIRGISLVSLTIATIVLVILANVIIYNVRDNLKVGKLKEMQDDIENLRDKVSSYYAQNGKIPADLTYTNTDAIGKIGDAGVISDAVDTGDFFVIDLSALENLTLNNGKDFENVKEDQENVNNYTDLYIINETSHNIFYVAGITVDNETYYTDYRSDSIDKASVDLRYVENIKIPEGFYYVEGTKDTGIIIKSNDNTQEYIWISENNKIEAVPEDVNIDANQKEDFIKSVNRYQGYYKSTNSNEVIYLELENWSPVYDKEGTYKDKNGDTAYIPAKFQVSETPGENTINEGLVIKDSNNNQFVWVPVENISNFHTIDGYSNGSAQGALSNFLEPYTNGYSTEVEEYNAMKASVEKYHGFYIGRFEAGKDDNGNVVVQKNMPVYSKIQWGASMTDATGGAVELSKKFATEKGYTSVTSTLCYSVQWDATMQFFDSNYLAGTCDSSSYVVNSTGKGNYSGNLMNTGSNDAYSLKNIYDMAGNVWDWTMEACNYNSNSYRSARGGSYDNDGSDSPTSSRTIGNPAGNNDDRVRLPYCLILE